MPRPEHTLHVEGIILRHSDWGEADRMVTLYTRERGKIRAVAKGVRRLHSRKAGHLEPFTRSALLLAHGRDLWIVTQADTLDAYLPLHDDLVRLGHAAYAVELLDRFTYEEGENRTIYRLLQETLERIARGEELFLAMRYYEVRMLDLLGFRPELQKCIQCQAEIKPQDQFFSALRGGVLCPNCGMHAPDVKPVSMRALRLLRHYQRSSYPDAARAQPSPDEQSEVERLLQWYLTYILERGLNTPDFIKAMQQK